MAPSSRGPRGREQAEPTKVAVGGHQLAWTETELARSRRRARRKSTRRGRRRRRSAPSKAEGQNGTSLKKSATNNNGNSNSNNDDNDNSQTSETTPIIFHKTTTTSTIDGAPKVEQPHGQTSCGRLSQLMGIGPLADDPRAAPTAPGATGRRQHLQRGRRLPGATNQQQQDPDNSLSSRPPTDTFPLGARAPLHFRPAQIGQPNGPRKVGRRSHSRPARPLSYHNQVAMARRLFVGGGGGLCFGCDCDHVRASARGINLNCSSKLLVEVDLMQFCLSLSFSSWCLSLLLSCSPSNSNKRRQSGGQLGAWRPLEIIEKFPLNAKQQQDEEDALCVLQAAGRPNLVKGDGEKETAEGKLSCFVLIRRVGWLLLKLIAPAADKTRPPGGLLEQQPQTRRTSNLSGLQVNKEQGGARKNNYCDMRPNEAQSNLEAFLCAELVGALWGLQTIEEEHRKGRRPRRSINQWPLSAIRTNCKLVYMCIQRTRATGQTSVPSESRAKPKKSRPQAGRRRPEERPLSIIICSSGLPVTLQATLRGGDSGSGHFGPNYNEDVNLFAARRRTSVQTSTTFECPADLFALLQLVVLFVLVAGNLFGPFQQTRRATSTVNSVCLATSAQTELDTKRKRQNEFATNQVLVALRVAWPKRQCKVTLSPLRLAPPLACLLSVIGLYQAAHRPTMTTTPIVGLQRVRRFREAWRASRFISGPRRGQRTARRLSSIENANEAANLSCLSLSLLEDELDDQPHLDQEEEEEEEPQISLNNNASSSYITGTSSTSTAPNTMRHNKCQAATESAPVLSASGRPHYVYYHRDYFYCCCCYYYYYHNQCRRGSLFASSACDNNASGPISRFDAVQAPTRLAGPRAGPAPCGRPKATSNTRGERAAAKSNSGDTAATTSKLITTTGAGSARKPAAAAPQEAHVVVVVVVAAQQHQQQQQQGKGSPVLLSAGQDAGQVEDVGGAQGVRGSEQKSRSATLCVRRRKSSAAAQMLAAVLVAALVCCCSFGRSSGHLGSGPPGRPSIIDEEEAGAGGGKMRRNMSAGLVSKIPSPLAAEMTGELSKLLSSFESNIDDDSYERPEERHGLGWARLNGRAEGRPCRSNGHDKTRLGRSSQVAQLVRPPNGRDTKTTIDNNLIQKVALQEEGRPRHAGRRVQLCSDVQQNGPNVAAPVEASHEDHQARVVTRNDTDVGRALGGGGAHHRRASPSRMKLNGRPLWPPLSSSRSRSPSTARVRPHTKQVDHSSHDHHHHHRHRRHRRHRRLDHEDQLQLLGTRDQREAPFTADRRHLRHLGHQLRAPPSTGSLGNLVQFGNHLQAPAGGGGGAQCPAQCSCTWKHGKHFADCSNHRNELRQPPAGLNPLLQVLNLTWNHIDHLPASAFNSKQLNNLQRIYLSNCQLESVHLGAFENLKLIVELDFSWNKLTSIPVRQMSHLSLLRRLSMRGNPLGRLTDETTTGAATRKAGAPKEPDGWSRLLETYPELMRGLLKRFRKGSGANLRLSRAIKTSGQQFDPNDDNEHDDDQTKLVQMLANLMHRMDPEELKQPDEEQDDESGDDNLNADEQANQLNSEDEQENESSVDNNELNRAQGSRKVDDSSVALSRHFRHLQELDLGQCKLTYIKWTALANLGSLKRLYLDGNQLSQLSGKLVQVLPVGLHQISLEDNDWRCDCRLLALKRWLLDTRVPLNAPVKCRTANSRKGQSKPISRRQLRPMQAADKQPPATSSASSLSSSASSSSSRGLTFNASSQSVEAVLASPQEDRIEFLDELQLDEFVCPPEANHAKWSSAAAANDDNLSRQADQLTPSKVNLTRVLEYLEPTLVSPSRQQTPNEAKSNHSRHLVGSRKRDIIHSMEGDNVVLKCSFLAYPETSVDVVWLADYNHLQRQQPAEGPARLKSVADLDTETNYRGRLPSEERFVVLYESSLYRTGDNVNGHGHNISLVGNSESVALEGKQQVDEEGEPMEQPKRRTFDEISLYNSRILIQESRAQINDGDQAGHEHHHRQPASVLKESQIIIQSAQVDDSARYKCIGLNGAGQSHFEFLLRVTRSPNKLSRDPLYDINSQQEQQQRQFDVHNSSASLAPTTGRQFNSGAPTRDQRANGSAFSWWLETAPSSPPPTPSEARRKGHDLQQGNNHSQAPGGSQSAMQSKLQPGKTSGQQAAAAATSQHQTTYSVWLKGSATFQIVMVVVSCLMGTVIVAFLLVCIVIYQIKPTGLQQQLEQQQHILLPAMYAKQAGAQNNENPMMTTTTISANGHHQINAFTAPDHAPLLANGTGNNSMGQLHSDSIAISNRSPLLAAQQQTQQQQQQLRLTQSSTLNTINSSLISAIGDQQHPQGAHMSQTLTRQLTPILVCDPISGQAPIHFMHTQQQQHLISPVKYRPSSQQLSQQDQDKQRWTNKNMGETLTRPTTHINSNNYCL